jgi:hypothetical protein
LEPGKSKSHAIRIHVSSELQLSTSAFGWTDWSKRRMGKNKHWQLYTNVGRYF